MNEIVRAVTDDEVGFYREHGWVRLPRLIDPRHAATLRERAEPLIEPVGGPPSSDVDRAFGQRRYLAEKDAAFGAVAFGAEMGSNASRLLVGDKRIRVQIDNLLVKEPAGGGHGETRFHQDFPWMPMDRSSMLTVWIALVDIPAAMGSMRFYDGSHRYGTLGRTFVRDGDDAPNQQPWLAELGTSPPLDLAPGDATVHDCLMIHGAPANRTDAVRVSYAITYFDADALYTGTPYAQTDELGLTVNEPFDHPRFPLVHE